MLDEIRLELPCVVTIKGYYRVRFLPKSSKKLGLFWKAEKRGGKGGACVEVRSNSR